MRALPQAVVASDEEVLQFLETQRLCGKGLGWVDAHLLASARLTHCQLWTKDGPLLAAAKALGLSAMD
jgi:predicted nucleic acid-binding protein